MILFGIPVWATLGSERLHQIAIPARVRRLVLFPDNDVAGEIGVAHALASYAMPGRDIDIEFPPAGFKDWNDVLRMGGAIGRAHVCTPVTNAHLVCRLLLEQPN